MRGRLLSAAPMLVAVLVVVGLVLALGACGGGDQGGGARAVTDHQIVFRRWFDPGQTKGAIFSMNLDGSHLRQITHPPKDRLDDQPAVSPDGQRVAFERKNPYDDSTDRIKVLNLKTGDTREVTPCTGQCWADDSPAFSPDGHSLAYHRITHDLEGIWVVGLDGSDPHQVTNVDPKPPAAFRDVSSAFSPDGKMLVFERVHLEDERFAVFVEPIDSSGSPEDARQITPWKMNCQDHPEFSPDGKLVLFRCLPKGEEGPSNLYWVHPDGTGLHALTHSPAGTKTYLGSSFSPSFAAGEGWIVVGRQPGYGIMDNADVFRVRIEDGEVVSSENLTKSGIWDSFPVWSQH